MDCSSLPEGLHFAEISASDSTAPWRGALFRVPVTVIKPAHVGDSSPFGASDAASAGSSGEARARSHMQLVGAVFTERSHLFEGPCIRERDL